MSVKLELVRRLTSIEGVPIEVHLDVRNTAALCLLDAVHDHVRDVIKKPIKEVTSLWNLHAVLEKLLLLSSA